MPRSNPDSSTCRQTSRCFNDWNISLNKRMLYPQTRIRVKDKLCNFTPESHSTPYNSPMKTEFELFDRFYLLIFYFEKFSTWIWRFPFAVYVKLKWTVIGKTAKNLIVRRKKKKKNENIQLTIVTTKTLTVIFFLARRCHFESANIGFYGFKCLASWLIDPLFQPFLSSRQVFRGLNRRNLVTLSQTINFLTL